MLKTLYSIHVHSLSAGEVCVGSLPNLAHGVSGQLCVVGNKSLVIRNFYYDSGGPGQSTGDSSPLS